MNYIVFDDKFIKKSLLPLTYFRPVSNIRCGILTLQEKWEYFLNSSVSVLSENYLSDKFPVHFENYKPKERLKYLNSSVLKRMEIFGKDIEHLEVEPNKLSTHRLIEYYDAGWKIWYE